MNKLIRVTVGIYDTVYQLVEHRNGDITVVVPYVKWVANSGSLAFEQVRFNADTEAREIVKVKAFFENDELLNDSCESLNDYLY